MANSVSVWTRADDVGNDILTAACLLFMDFGPVLVSIALERLSLYMVLIFTCGEAKQVNKSLQTCKFNRG